MAIERSAHATNFIIRRTLNEITRARVYESFSQTVLCVRCNVYVNYVLTLLKNFRFNYLTEPYLLSVRFWRMNKSVLYRGT